MSVAEDEEKETKKEEKEEGKLDPCPSSIPIERVCDQERGPSSSSSSSSPSKSGGRSFSLSSHPPKGDRQKGKLSIHFGSWQPWGRRRRGGKVNFRILWPETNWWERNWEGGWMPRRHLSILRPHLLPPPWPPWHHFEGANGRSCRGHESPKSACRAENHSIKHVQCSSKKRAGNMLWTTHAFSYFWNQNTSTLLNAFPPPAPTRLNLLGRGGRSDLCSSLPPSLEYVNCRPKPRRGGGGRPNKQARADGPAANHRLVRTDSAGLNYTEKGGGGRLTLPPPKNRHEKKRKSRNGTKLENRRGRGEEGNARSSSFFFRDTFGS